MRTILLCIIFPACVAAQCFDVVQMVSPEATAGVAGIPEGKSMLRIRALPPVDDPDDNISWRGALVKEVGELQGAMSLRITDTGSGFTCQVKSRSGRRRYNIENEELDPKGLTLVKCGWQNLDKAQDVLVFRRVAEDAPFEQPTMRQLLHELSSELLPRKPATGVFGGIVAKVREKLSNGNAPERSFEDWLAHLPLARLLEPARVAELLTALQSDERVTTAESAALLRCALGDVTAIEDVDAVHGHNWYSARAALRAGWAGSDDPAVRGAFGLAASRSGHNTVPNWKEGHVLYEEIGAGRAKLPGTEDEQRRTLAQFEALARAADAGPAITFWAVAVVGMAALLWSTRRLLDRLLAS